MIWLGGITGPGIDPGLYGFVREKVEVGGSFAWQRFLFPALAAPVVDEDSIVRFSLPESHAGPPLLVVLAGEGCWVEGTCSVLPQRAETQKRHVSFSCQSTI